jgi:chemotaxis protein CheY-P-specific phosphatase CheC
MKEAVNEAVEVFFEDTLGYKLEKAKTAGSGFYGTSISLYEDGDEKNWYLFFKEDTLRKIAQVLLFEDNLNKDEFIDLLEEVANQIIGTAKVKLEEKNKNKTYKLGTPEFLGDTLTPTYFKPEKSMLYKVKNRTFLISMDIEH